MKTTVRLDDNKTVVFEQITEDWTCPTCGQRRPKPVSATMTLRDGDLPPNTVPCRLPTSYEEARASAHMFTGGITGLPGL